MEKGKIVSIEDRIPKLKEQRRKKANRRLIFLLLFFFLLIIFVIYFQSPLSHVKNIKVSGNSLYSVEDLKQKSGLTNKTNIWTINKDKVGQLLESSAGLKSANVSIIFPNTVALKVEEYRKVGYYVDEGNYIPVIENGDMLLDEHMPSIPYDAPLIKVKKEQIKMIGKIAEELSKIPVEVYNAISEVNYTPQKTDTTTITIYMNDGYQVVASLPTFAEKMSFYSSIVSQLTEDKKGIINLEVSPYFEAFESTGEKKDEN